MREHLLHSQSKTDASLIRISPAKFQPEVVKGVCHLLVPLPKQFKVLEAEVQEVGWGYRRTFSCTLFQGLATFPVADTAVGRRGAGRACQIPMGLLLIRVP